MKNTFLYLLQPTWRSILNRNRSREASGTLKNLFLIVLGMIFWVGIFFLFYRALSYFKGVEEIGNLLAVKILSMVMLIFFSILVFSNIITALSSYYLSDDLILLHSSPIFFGHIYQAKFIETLIESSWMIVFFGIPIFGAYGVVYQANWIFYVGIIIALIPMVVIAAGIGIIITMVLVSIFPARGTRDILFLLTIIFVVGIYLLFRFLQPERLFNPEQFDQFVDFLAMFKTPTSVYLPNHWFTEFLVSLIFQKEGNIWFPFFLLLSTAMASVAIGGWVAGRIYSDGWMKSQEGKRTVLSPSSWVHRMSDLWTHPFGPQAQAIIQKDIKSFLRETTQWTQLLLLGALVVVYLYNFRVLDLDKFPFPTFYIENMFAFLNMGLAAFVISAVAIRFVFPAVSIEGKSFWFIRSAPITIRRLLWSKFWMYLLPLLFLAEVLIIISNHFLHVTSFMMGLSIVTMFFMTFGIVALGIGLGAIYPRFFMENVAKIATGYGAILYMILSMGFIGLVVVLEAWPVYIIFVFRLRGIQISLFQWAVISGSFTLVFLLNLAAFYLPMRWGIRHLEQSEY